MLFCMLPLWHQYATMIVQQCRHAFPFYVQVKSIYKIHSKYIMKSFWQWIFITFLSVLLQLGGKWSSLPKNLSSNHMQTPEPKGSWIHEKSIDLQLLRALPLFFSLFPLYFLLLQQYFVTFFQKKKRKRKATEGFKSS